MKEIKVLTIDDEVAEAVKESLTDFKVNDSSLAVEAEESSHKGLEKIKQLMAKKKFYDVIIVDMKMDGSEDRGLDILTLPVPSLKIVVTALATVENCIQCLRMGAYDYIDKNSLQYDPFDQLKVSIKEGLTQRLETPANPINQWLSKNKKNLLKEYPGKHIAVLAEIVVDADANENALRKRMKRKYPYFYPDIAKVTGKDIILSGKR